MIFRKPMQPPEPPPAPDPLSPWEEHAELRRAADRAAAEDAQHHAEDLLDRALPYTGLAVAQAETRLERLGACRADRLAFCSGEEESARHAAEDADRSLGATTAALELAGIDPACVDLPERREGWLRRARRALWLLPEDPWKQYDDLMRRHAASRRERFAAVERLRAAEQSSARLMTVADAVARAEIALAAELVARYVAAVVHHVGPESLADGAGPAEQNVVAEPPEWLGVESVA